MKTALLVSTVLFASNALAAPANPPSAGGLSADEAKAIATDAYVFLYPLVTMDATKKAMTNAKQAGTDAPINQIYPTARSTFTSSTTNRRRRSRRPTGCPRPRTTSS